MAKTQWWDWSFHRVDETLSILDVLAWREMDYKLAGLLWLLMEQRPSLLVAAGPSWVGKTTLFHSLLDFLPPNVKQVTLRGFGEDFKSLGSDRPENTYLVTEEISNHSYEYLWGYQVAKAFELLSRGYAMGGTIHARNIKEVAYTLTALRVPLPLIANLGVVVTLQAARGRSYYDEFIRYVDTVSTVNLTKDGLVAQVLAMRHLPEEPFIYQPEQSLHDILANKFSIKYDSISSEMESRGDIISRLHENKSSREEVRKTVSEFYRSQLP